VLFGAVLLLIIGAAAAQPVISVTAACLLALLTGAWVGVQRDLDLIRGLSVQLGTEGGPSRSRHTPFEVRFTIAHPGRRALRHVSFALRTTGEPAIALLDPGGFVLNIPARARGTARLSLTFARAGHWHVHGVEFQLSGPLGLTQAQRYHPADLALHVRPRRLPQKRAEALIGPSGALREREGRHRNTAAGHGTELRELRDYVPGDALRRMAWRATARRQRPLVRAYDDESVRRLQLLIDIGPTMRAGLIGETPLDRAVDLAATLIELAQHDRVGLTTFDHRVYGHLEAATGRQQIQKMLRHLMDLTRVVDADLTEVSEGELVARVGAFLEVQDGMALARDGEDPWHPLVARTLADPLGELYDVAALYAAVTAYLARERDRGHAALYAKSRPAHDTLSARLRLFCVLRGITLPYRLTGPAHSTEDGLVQAVSRCLTRRSADDLVVVSDLRGLAPDGAGVRALRLARARKRRVVVIDLGGERTPVHGALSAARVRLVRA
jgi:uncharacterized protein (DUF58 family)